MRAVCSSKAPKRESHRRGTLPAASASGGMSNYAGSERLMRVASSTRIHEPVDRSFVNVCHVYPYEIAAVRQTWRSTRRFWTQSPGSASEQPFCERTAGRSQRSAWVIFSVWPRCKSDSRWRNRAGGASAHRRGSDLASPRADIRVGGAQASILSRGQARELYRAVHAAIMGGLVGFGIRADRSGEVFPPADCERSRPLLCFTDRSPEDILIQGTKVVGSAQRRRGGAVLQHGSILLARSSQTPELAGSLRCRGSLGRSWRVVRPVG